MADEAPQLVTAPTDGEDAPATSDNASKLKELIDAANLQYSLKNYEKAAEIYSSATELQAELNGEMAPENAELLYLYGRCLFKVAVAKSDVLGGQVAGEKKKSNSNGVTKHNGGPSGENVAASDEKLAEDIVEAAVEQKDAPKSTAQQEKAPATQPYFQITGMENWDSDEEEADAEGEGEGEDEEDDFATAFEILDVARVLLQRQIEALVDAAGKKASEEGEANLRHLRERLAETHDLQAEIALENERFGDAIPDFRASLALKQDLFPKESEVIAEAHYKLALALEFDSVQGVRDAQAELGQQTVTVMKEDIDEEMRKEAANEMESAIESCRLRIAKEEAALKTLDPEAAKAMEKTIADVKEIVEDMEQRLHDLRDPTYLTRVDGPAGPLEVLPSSGILAQSRIGETVSEQKARIDEAAKNARDLTGLVRHKRKPKVEETQAGAADDGTAQTNGKRKLDQTDDAEGEVKKVKVDDS